MGKTVTFLAMRCAFLDEALTFTLENLQLELHRVWFIKMAICFIISKLLCFVMADFWR